VTSPQTTGRRIWPLGLRRRDVRQSPVEIAVAIMLCNNSIRSTRARASTGDTSRPAPSGDLHLPVRPHDTGIAQCSRNATGRNGLHRAIRLAGASRPKRTPISRPESRIKSAPSQTNCVTTMQQRMPPSFLQTLTAPVFSLCRLRTESHQTPIGIKLAAMLCDCPGGLCHPRETLVPSRVQWVACILCGYRHDGDASPLVARDLGDSVLCAYQDGARAASKSFAWLRASPLSWLTALGQTVIRNTGAHRRASGLAACGNTPAPACARAP
jgi:hypothetical protein